MNCRDNPVTPVQEPSLPGTIGIALANAGYGNAHQISVDNVKSTLVDSLQGEKFST